MATTSRPFTKRSSDGLGLVEPQWRRDVCPRRGPAAFAELGDEDAGQGEQRLPRRALAARWLIPRPFTQCYSWNQDAGSWVGPKDTPTEIGERGLGPKPTPQRDHQQRSNPIARQHRHDDRCLRTAGTRPAVFFMGASDFVAHNVTGVADIAMIATTATYDYVPRLLEALDYPATVVPEHWDNFEAIRRRWRRTTANASTRW